MSATVAVAFVGHFARDRLVVGGVAEAASGGGVYYGAMAARRLGYSVAVITKLHPDDFPFLDEMRRAGIVVHASSAPQTTGIENIYPDRSTDRRICRPLGFAGPFTAAEIPPLAARVTIITPLMAGEVSAEIVRLLASRGPIGLDVQGFARVRQGDVLVTRDWPGKKTDLAEVTYHAGGVLAYAGGTFYEGRFTPREILGRTGRGDTAFAAYVSARTHADPEYACRLAAAVVSLKMEHPGPYRFTRIEAEQRMAG